MRKQLAWIIWGLVGIVVAINLVIYLKRHAEYLTCDINRLNATKTFLGLASSSTALPATVAKGNGSTSRVSVEEEFCRPRVPCVYPDEVDFRIIVMSFKRTESLKKLLSSLNDVEVDGDKASLEIFIDRDKEGNVHEPTIEAARSHEWPLGFKRVHIWSEHVGIYGQWIDTWRPQNSSGEISLILEDDITVSKYCYRWLKAAHKSYDNRTDIQGYTLQTEGIKTAKGQKPLSGPKDDTVYLYKILGSWGFSPHPKVWRDFQDWYYVAIKDKSFRPYVDGILMTQWYKFFETKKKADSMWTIWFIWYTDKHNLFCLYSNLEKHTGSKVVAVGVNRQEPGLHYGGKGKDTSGKLMKTWQDSYVKFPERTTRYGYDGKGI